MFIKIFISHFYCFTHSYNFCYIFCTCSFISFLMSPILYSLKINIISNIKSTYSLRSIKLMCRHRKCIYSHFFNIYSNISYSLNSICMKNYIIIFCNFCNFFYWLNSSHFIISKHYSY